MLNSIHSFILVCGCCHNLTAANWTATQLQGAKISLVHRNKLLYIYITATSQKGTPCCGENFCAEVLTDQGVE